MHPELSAANAPVQSTAGLPLLWSLGSSNLQICWGSLSFYLIRYTMPIHVSGYNLNVVCLPPPSQNAAVYTMDLTEISTSASTIRSLHTVMGDSSAESPPSSPRSSTLPSPPDSPSSESVSSMPSVSSSFFFSSAAASPPHSQPHSDHARESTQGLIIPSLTLPEALHQPTPYGQTLGDLRLLVVGGKDFLTKLLLEDNDDIVDEGQWEDTGFGRILRASTDWIDHRDAHGLEKFEPTRNVEINELPGYECNNNVCSCFHSFQAALILNTFC